MDYSNDGRKYNRVSDGIDIEIYAKTHVEDDLKNEFGTNAYAAMFH